MAIRQRIVVPFGGHVIGQGFNSETMERVGTGLTPQTQGDDPVADGQQAIYRFRMITSQDALEKALNFNADVDARYGLLSGGAKFSFAESQAINRSSTYLLASCVVTNALRFGKNFRPTPNAEPVIQAGDRDQFRLSFGDYFTEALRTGGEFHAIVRMTSSNTSHQQKIAASLHAEMNGFVGAGSFSAALTTAQTDTSSSTEIEIEIHQSAGQGQQIQIPGSDAASIRTHMNNFAAYVLAHPSAYEAELVTYETLALPFPPAIETEQKREVLADCLVRKQRYWSILSEIRFAMTEAGARMFVDLPPRPELQALEREFISVLNDLMEHARKVSAGTIEPALFVPQDEPQVPQFKRPATHSFAYWWERRDELSLFVDERTIIHRVGAAARVFLLVEPSHATDDMVERAAARVEALDFSSRSSFDFDPPLSTLESLPKIFGGPLRILRAERTRLRNLRGIETFSRLEELIVPRCQLEDLTALSAVNGLRRLSAFGNVVTSLEPLRQHLELQFLEIAGNLVTDLEPLRELRSLWFVSIGDGIQQDSEEGDSLPPIQFRGNPVMNARVLANLEHLRCPLTQSDRMRLRKVAPDGVTQVDQGVITRIGNSSRYQFASDYGTSAGICSLGGCFKWIMLDHLGGPVVIMVLFWPDAKQCSIGATHPADPTAALVSTMVSPLLGDPNGLGGVIDFFFGVRRPTSIVEITAIS